MNGRFWFYCTLVYNLFLFYVLFKKSLTKSRSWQWSSFSKSCIVSFLYLKLQFIWNQILVWYKSSSLFFLCVCPFDLHYLLKRPYFLHFPAMSPSSCGRKTYTSGSSSGFHPVPLDSLSTLVPILQSLNCCSFTLSAAIWKLSPTSSSSKQP